MILLLIPLLNYSQEVISSGGDQFNNSEGSLTFTIGEPVTESFFQTDQILTQGFQQNYEAILTVESIPRLNNISVYPNPFNDFITVSFAESISDEISIILMEINGKVILKKNVSDKHNIIDLEITDLPNGMYLISIQGQAENSIIYRLVKNN